MGQFFCVQNFTRGRKKKKMDGTVLIIDFS